ncbi:hypothetical protein SuNHUV7_41190 (plasmid) [Pseudoseohaeicola sp. NH-UV-7]
MGASPFNTGRLTGRTRNGGYKYTVEGQWQGRHRYLRVLGDKNGSADTKRLLRRPWLADHIEDTLQVPVRIVHVYRNPFDVVSSVVRRARESGRGPTDISAAIGLVENSMHAQQVVIDRLGAQRVHSVAHEAHLHDPQREIAAIIRFLGLAPESDYVAACAALCFEKPKRSFSASEWSRADVARVRQLIDSVAFLNRYAQHCPLD